MLKKKLFKMKVYQMYTWKKVPEIINIGINIKDPFFAFKFPLKDNWLFKFITTKSRAYMQEEKYEKNSIKDERSK